MSGLVNQVIDLRLQSRAYRENRRNYEHVRYDPGAQPCWDELLREPQIQREEHEGNDPCGDDAHREGEGNFPFQLRVHN